MIIVIADDLTGAAEIGGLALRYNLNVEICTTVPFQSKADLLIVSTDTRSMKQKEAVAKTQKVTENLLRLKPTLIFKKVDSVLRGHIVAEMLVHLKELNYKKALLVPANPALNRTIKDGTYFLNGQPIHLSSFSKDPEFAITNSGVLDMLHHTDSDIAVHQLKQGISQQGITVGEAETLEDVKSWASLADQQTLLAGASNFFTAILELLNEEKRWRNLIGEEPFRDPALYVCGSTFAKSREAIRAVKEEGGPVCYMPTGILLSPNPADSLYETWSDEIVAVMSVYGKAIIAIDEQDTEGKIIDPKALRAKTAMAVKKVFEKIYLREMLIEGGATAAAIIKSLNFNTFFPIKEISPGVIRMNVEGKDDLYLTMKPGSYEWSPAVWNFSEETYLLRKKVG